MDNLRKKQIIAFGKVCSEQVEQKRVGYSDTRIFLRKLTSTGLISRSERNYIVGTILKNNPIHTGCSGNYYLPSLRIYNI